MPKNRDGEKDFDVFLSHNSADKPEVRQLADALEGRGFGPWHKLEMRSAHSEIHPP